MWRASADTSSGSSAMARDRRASRTSRATPWPHRRASRNQGLGRRRGACLRRRLPAAPPQGASEPTHLKPSLPGLTAARNNRRMENRTEPSAGRHGIGQPVQRTEDPVLLRGEGRYTDDVNEPGQAYAWMVRSPHAHGVLKKVDIETAKAM